MEVLARIAVLVIVGVSCTLGQDGDELGLPVEYDIFGLEEDDAFYKERNSYTVPEETLRRICDEYDLQVDSKKLDCSNIKAVPKSLKVTDHVIRKRDVEETPVEGSGEHEGIIPANDDPQPELKQESPETETSKQENDASDPVPEPSNDEETKVEPAVPYAEEKADNTNNNEESAANEETKAEGENANNEEKTPEKETNETSPSVVSPVPYGEETDNENKPSAEEEPAVKEDQEAAPSNEVAAVPQEQDPNQSTAAASNTTPQAETTVVTEIPTVTSQAVTELVKKGRKLSPNEVAASKPQEPESKGEEEKIHEHQSGNAVLDGPGSETLEGSEAVVRTMSDKENIKETSNTDLPKSGESSEETQQGRKDTKVLIVLLVAVVVIGGAAFAYNFIKKRKQKKADASRTENGSAAVQKTDKDAEQGTELKPLMKNSEQQKPVVEYKDEKETPRIEVTN